MRRRSNNPSMRKTQSEEEDKPEVGEIGLRCFCEVTYFVLIFQFTK